MTARTLLVSLLLCAAVGPAGAQTKPPAQEKKPAPAPVPFSYDSGGRRDPFKELFQGQDVRKEKKAVAGLADLDVDEVVLMGIIKAGGKVEAIISLPQGFPLSLHVGDVLADGYVLSIEETQVVFRKTRDAKGLPLVKPRDVVKDIISEEP
jgi:Tfp pilus assembly protein PilP